MRYSRVVFAKVRTLSFPCGQPRDTAKKDMQEKLGLGRSAARVSKVWLRRILGAASRGMNRIYPFTCHCLLSPCRVHFLRISVKEERDKKEQALAVIGMSSRAEKPR